MAGKIKKKTMHVQEYGVVPVLYASQWFLTAFSCPFPTVFSCRVVDVMLTENCGHAMLRVGLAVIKACSSALLELHDFEDLVTHLKVGHSFSLTCSRSSPHSSSQSQLQ